jgi:uncharacterized membrane protein
MRMIELLAISLLGKQGDALDPDERNVLARIAASRPDLSLAPPDTGWDRLADRVARIGGSWPFIFTFLGVLIGWMLLNTDVLAHWQMAFDPYPYIFLNLMLSMLAAIQAPIIMMSQNRAAAQDRRAAAENYAVNLRAEAEIKLLQARLDVVLA